MKNMSDFVNINEKIAKVVCFGRKKLFLGWIVANKLLSLTKLQGWERCPLCICEQE